MERYVVVAPFRSARSSGTIARNLVRALDVVGAPAGAIATHAPLDGCTPVFESRLECPVRLRGSTVVHHAALADLPRSLAQHPTRSADRRVAYIDWPRPRFEDADLEILLPFDEVWLTTHFQRELLTASGLPRNRVHVVHPAVDTALDAREHAGAFVSNHATHAFPLACAEAMARGVPVVAVDPRGTSELLDAETAILIPRAEHSADRALAARGRQRALELCGFESVGRSILERASSPRRAPARVLAGILAALGLKSPADWIADSRSRVLLCSIQNEHDDWRTPLRGFLERHCANDDVTLCLWIDADLAPLVESLTREVQSEIERARSTHEPGDVLLLSAPLEHVPWDRVELATAA